jgi:hypothetical protein
MMRSRIVMALACCVLTRHAVAKPGKRKVPPAPPAPTALAPAAAQPAASSPRSPEGSAKSIAVTVVEVAGGQAYLKPGTLGGVLRGTKITLGRRQYTVVQASDSFCTIVVGDDSPHEQDKGEALVVAEKAAKTVELEKPKPVATWEHDWTEEAPPASSQAPRFVPLGSAERDRRWDVRLSALGGGLIPLGQRGDTVFRAELDARVHAEPFDAPVAFDVDASFQRWFDKNLAAREGAEARPTLFVRELMASYGPGALYGAIGRMPYAARTLGTLDGVRIDAPVGTGFSIGAFGGTLPNPLSGAPSTAAERFGVEAVYSRPDVGVRPEAALVAQGSTFQGKIDERRIAGVLALYPGLSRLGAHVEVSAFDPSNPWGAKPIEVTSAGFDTSVRVGVFQLEGRFDLRQPERSLWLASFLPPSWFCTPAPTAGAATGTEPCGATASTRAYSVLDVGVQLDRVSFTMGATRTADLSDAQAPQMTGVFANGRIVRIARVLRFDASASYSHATYLDMVGATAGPGVTLLGDALDVGVYYRGTALKYPAVPTSLFEHAGGGVITLFPSAALLVALQGEAMMGPDTKALVLFGAVTWHPSF